MPLAALLGMGPKELTQILGKQAKVPADCTVLVGIRDLDYDERKLIKRSGVRVYTMKDIDEQGMSEVMREAITIASGPKVEPFHISFDLDGVDPLHDPGVGTAVPGGLTYREAHLAMELIAECGRACSIEVTAIISISAASASISLEGGSAQTQSPSPVRRNTRNR